MEQTAALVAERLIRAFTERSDAGDDIRVEIVNDAIVRIVVDSAASTSLFEKVGSESLGLEAILENEAVSPLEIYMHLRKTDEPYGTNDLPKVNFGDILAKPMFPFSLDDEVITWLTCAALDAFGRQNEISKTSIHKFANVNRLIADGEMYAVHIQATPTITDKNSDYDHAELIEELFMAGFDSALIFSKHLYDFFSNSEDVGISTGYHRNEGNILDKLKESYALISCGTPEENVAAVAKEIKDMFPGYKIDDSFGSVLIIETDLVIAVIELENIAITE